MRSASPSAPYYSPGTAAPASGVYLVRHYQHRLPHEVTILQGELFPKCNKCGDRVTFELVRDALDMRDDVDLHDAERAKRKSQTG